MRGQVGRWLLCQKKMSFFFLQGTLSRAGLCIFNFFCFLFLLSWYGVVSLTFFLFFFTFFLKTLAKRFMFRTYFSFDYWCLCDVRKDLAIQRKNRPIEFDSSLTFVH